MRRVRWRKVWKDIWSNKTRTILVILSILVGVTAIGMVLGSQLIIDENLPEDYAAVNPTAGTIFTLNTFDDDMVEAIRRMPEVEEAEGRRFVTVRFEDEDGTKRSIQLFAIANFDDISISQLSLEEGQFPPPERGMLIERAAFSEAFGGSLADPLGVNQFAVGDTITVEPPDGRLRDIQLSGTVHDISQLPAFLNGTAYGYITFDTLEWLGEPRDYNQVVYTVSENKLDIEHVQDVGRLIENRLERDFVSVLFTLVFPPGDHPAQNFLNAFSFILGAMGILSLVLSGFLIVNILSAILSQQVRQIGIMKSIGARTGQITWMYIVMVLTLGLLSLVISIPLGALGAAALSQLFANLLNFNVSGFALDPRVVILQVAISILAPLLASLIPVFRGVRVTVREAISEQGLGKGQFGNNFLDQLIVRSRSFLPGGRPTQISLRNTFRRKARLALTLLTLSLASMIFVSILSVQASLLQTLDDALNYFDYNIQVIFDQPYRVDRIQQIAEPIPGVNSVETWGFGSARRIRPDGSESDNLLLYAPEPDTEMLNPIIIDGRWIEEGDTNKIVVNTDFLRNDEDVVVGSVITLDINGRESEWEVVGIARGILFGANAFTNFDYYSRVTKNAGQAQISLVTLNDESTENQLNLGTFIEDRYRNSGFRVQQMQTISQVRTIVSAIFNVMIGFLLFMAILLGFVGGLGLMGTMSINVIERTREVGVMRAIGASDRSILLIILAEGLIIGLISWAIGTASALPISRLLTNQLGQVLLSAAPSYIFSIRGAIIWLVTILILAFVASFLPAWNASRLTVREVLSYE
ncbi:MAG: FtsX-like permease family protein [Chloroflexota bacterium]